ncbi:MAG TPA: hypothetical protein DD723_01300 [Candidatus Omnitrophica bacterium]|nr:MAG: hypothetical protein A2Z81_02125 [Omnitrophica WOR_2 bacterium GWA2_45_18]OGX19942.1 MAG: hypothetical protein A2Y04_04170 [Omnitrophica WOR_2 bacterium GWC2_45_7]HBR14167.1 hypothetical protein [Candidatus Omnitrophota bacterium]
MEPFSILGVIVISMTAGAIVSIVTKKPNGPSCTTSKSVSSDKTMKGQEIVAEHTEERAQEVIDVEKEKAIDELITRHDYNETMKKRER